jgi:acyl carrier protein
MDDVMKFVMDYVERKGRIPKDADLSEFNYIQSGHIDSIALFKFAVDIEAEFGIEISDDDIMSVRFATVGGIVSLITDKMGGIR